MKTRYQPGDLDRVIILVDPTVARDEYGGFSITGNSCVRVWACKEDTVNRQMKEDMVAEQIVAHGQTVFVIRYKKYIDETWTIVDPATDLKYTIEGKTEIGRHQWTALHCMRKDNL